MGNIHPICCIHGLLKLLAANRLKRPAVFGEAADLLFCLLARQDGANNLRLYGLARVNRRRGWRLAWGPGGWRRRGWGFGGLNMSMGDVVGLGAGIPVVGQGQLAYSLLRKPKALSKLSRGAARAKLQILLKLPVAAVALVRLLVPRL